MGANKILRIIHVIIILIIKYKKINMEPNQNVEPLLTINTKEPAPPTQKFNNNLIRILIAILLLFIIGIGFYLWKVYSPSRQAEQLTNKAPVANVATTTSKVDETSKITFKINNINKDFTISNFPNVDFTLNTIIKIDILKTGLCNNSLPQEVRNEIRVNTGCWDKSVFDPNIDYSLVGITLHVANNSSYTVQGNLIKLGYLKENNSQVIFKLAQKDINFTSYGLSEGEDRTIQLSFWVPSSQSNLYLVYGATTTEDVIPPFNQKTMKAYDGAFKIDFASSTVTLSKTAPRKKLTAKSAVQNPISGSVGPLSFTLDNQVATGTKNEVVEFKGTLRNDSPTNTLYLNGMSGNLSSSELVLDSQPFFDLPPIKLEPGNSISGLLFRIYLSEVALPGDYLASVGILGGNDQNSTDYLSSAHFQLHVK